MVHWERHLAERSVVQSMAVRERERVDTNILSCAQLNKPASDTQHETMRKLNMAHCTAWVPELEVVETKRAEASANA